MGETQYKLPFPADRIAELLNIINELGAWAKASEKPTYTAEEVGARPSTWMPTASDVGARPNTWTPSASDVGADPSGTAAGAVSSHNTAEDAHNDIRLLVEGLATRLNTLADSDDETLDQVSELVAYIKSNRSLIEQITTGKVSVSDIIDNLTTNVANKPLSAAQGVKLKALIDAITVPTKVSQLENDSKYLTQHQDLTPYAKTSDLTAHTGNSTVHVTAEERAKWNNKSNFSGSYNDLSDKPTIPTVPSNVSAFTNDAGYLTQHQDISGKANSSDLTAHTVNSTVHITAEERTKWNKVIADLSTLTLGIHTDGLIYLYVNGEPVGTGVEAGASGDVVGYVDSDNNIIVSGTLAEGTYTVKYEMEDGSTVDIGTLNLSSAPAYTNQIPISTDSSGNLFEGGKGYKTGYRLSLSSGNESALAGWEVTGFIPCKSGDVIRIKNIYFPPDGDPNAANNLYVCLYDSSKAFIRGSTLISEFYTYGKDEGNGVYAMTNNRITGFENTAYIRIASSDINDTSIITINEQIE